MSQSDCDFLTGQLYGLWICKLKQYVICFLSSLVTLCLHQFLKKGNDSSFFEAFKLRLYLLTPVLDLGLVFTESLGPKAFTKVESNASFPESGKIFQLAIFFAVLNTLKFGKPII